MATRSQAVVEEPEAPRCFTGNLAWLLYRAHWALASELTAALAPVGVSPRGYHVLRAALSGEHTQRELAEMVGLDKTTMVVTMDELEAKGLAERRPSPTDRRARVIVVTEAGAEKVRRAQEIIERVHADVLSALPVADRKVFLDSLCKLTRDRLSEPVDCMNPVRRRAPR
jgi:MarR family transcriptional regulator, transcriptional regulator for hemolysin